MIGFLTIKTNLEIGVIASECSDLGTIKRKNMIDDGVDRFLSEIDIINAKIVIKPARLILEQ
jgi:hypothetical protein